MDIKKIRDDLSQFTNDINIELEDSLINKFSNWNIQYIHIHIKMDQDFELNGESSDNSDDYFQ